MKKLWELAHAILFKHKYLHFFATGASGVALNLGITWFFTTFVFGLERYFTGYIIGLAANFIYNFILHTKVTFGTKERHLERFMIFVIYGIAITALQAYLVRTITPMVGLEYYLFVIAAVILTLSSITFVFFKFSLFRENKEGVVKKEEKKSES